jgi:hypothetical protein
MPASPSGNRRDASRAPPASITYTSHVILGPIVSDEDHPIRLLTLLWCNQFRAEGHPAAT